MTPPEKLTTSDLPQLRGAKEVHAWLREAILTGHLSEGAELSQVQLAERLGVSRTPLREALRMLQAEGLVYAERNRRVRVAGFSIDDLEQVYATRIVMEALGVRLTVPLLTDEELRHLHDCLRDMNAFVERRDAIGWEQPHRRFHRQLVSHAGEQMVRTIDQLADHARRYRHLYVTNEPDAWTRLSADHTRLVDACEQRDAAGASHVLARHFAQTALTVIALIDAAHDPVQIRTALRMVVPVDPPRSTTDTHLRQRLAAPLSGHLARHEGRIPASRGRAALD